MIDYTFNNTLIKAYFEGDDSYIPTGEIIYLHERPLIIPNFMTELSQMIREAGELMVKHKLGHYAERLEKIAIKMGQQLPEVNEGNAETILGTMREAYKLSNDLLRKMK